MLPAAQIASSTTAPNIIPGTQIQATSVGGAMSTTQTFSVSSGMQETTQGNQQLSSNQRKALEEANKTSFGFFITQDSSFGNLILPVIPRIPPQPSAVPTPPITSTTVNTN